jgi:hypothetical protein
MTQLGLAHPEYGFEKHKGYGTSFHSERLRAYGPCIHHRYSFAPVRDCQKGSRLSRRQCPKPGKSNVMLREASGPLEASISVEALRAAPAALVAAAA